MFERSRHLKGDYTNVVKMYSNRRVLKLSNISDVQVAGFSLQHGYHSNPTTPKLEHTSKQEQSTNVMIQQKSRRLLMMNVLMSETC